MWVLVTRRHLVHLIEVDKVIRQYSDCTDDEKAIALKVNQNTRLNLIKAAREAGIFDKVISQVQRYGSKYADVIIEESR